MIINIRGTNGSGKTTLARQLIEPDPKPVDLVWYDSPTKRNPNRRRAVEGRGHPGGFLAVGSYDQNCGGLDTVPTFALQQQGVLRAVDLSVGPPKHVVCEGVLASTVAGSWLEFFKSVQPTHQVLVAYLDTPLELCLERIRQRQEASGRAPREIKADLVRDKMRAIEATREKFEHAGIATVRLRHDNALTDLLETIEDMEPNDA